MADKMKIMMIWAACDGNPNEAWLVEAWDEESISGNPDGWEKVLKESYRTYGGANVRVLTTDVDWGKVQRAFRPTNVSVNRSLNPTVVEVYDE